MKIPHDINQWPRVKQVGFYLESGLLLQPVYGPNADIDIKDRGKKPRLPLKERLAQSREDVLKRLSNGSDDNVGQIPDRSHPCVDLDDKSEAGRALQAFWLLYPDLEKLPRAVTNRGAHLHFVCNDIPAGIKTLTTVELLPDLSAQLICDPSLNIVMPPSVHASGVQYKWINAGVIPLMPWEEMQRIFKFQGQSAPPCAKSNEWKRTYRGDLRTLGIVALCEHLGVYGEQQSDETKHNIRCPWRSEHTDGDRPWSSSDSSTVILLSPGTIPVFKCSHTHGDRQKIEQLLAWAESREKGVVDRYCKERVSASGGLSQFRRFVGLSFFRGGGEKKVSLPQDKLERASEKPK
jgi:hypothetical protein